MAGESGYTEDPKLTKARFDESKAKHVRIMASSGNPESEEGKAIIANAKTIRDRMWRMQANQFCECPDEAHTGLTTSPSPCGHCEAKELKEDLIF